MATINCDHCGHSMDWYDRRACGEHWPRDWCHWCMHEFGASMDALMARLRDVRDYGTTF